MSWRVVGWLCGFGIGVAAAGAVPEDAFPGARPVLFGGSFLIIGAAVEILQALHDRRAGRLAARRRDPSAADGRVGLAAVPGFLAEPNAFDPRFRRFAGPGDRRPQRPGLAALTLPEGECPPLLGRVVIASLFLGRNGRSWAESELAEGHAALLRAATWIEREAVRYGAAVNLELADLYFVDDDDDPDAVAVDFVPLGDDVGPLEENATTKALVRTSRVAARLGFGDAPGLFQQVEARLDADAVVWLLHLREAGVSFAITRQDRALGCVSMAVCYAREASFPEPLRGPARVDPVTVAHELLHLFGASDKYARSLSVYGGSNVTAREVMRLESDRLGQLRIDPATASEVGWPAPEASGE